LTEQPSRLIVDFFPQEASDTVADQDDESASEADVEEKAPGKTKAALASTVTALPEKSAQANSKKGNRAPAGGDFVLLAKDQPLSPLRAAAHDDEQASANETQVFPHGIFDGGDPEYRRFTMKDFEVKDAAIAASRANIYLPFPMLELGSTHLKNLLAAPPIYEITPKDSGAGSEENKEARLLLTLFSNHRPAIFLSTATDFLKKYPESPYEEIIRYMMADTHYDLYRNEGTPSDFEEAMGLYGHLTEKFPNSPLTERSLLLMGYGYLERGDSFGALKTFQRFIRLKPDSKFNDQVKISIAEAYLKLDRFDDSSALFDEVEKNGKSPRARSDAAFRKGDVFFRKKDFAESIRQYKRAIETYPQASAKYPNAWYNLAEADFITEKYRDGLEAYRVFLQKFPDHTHGGYAMTRMGELMQILGADPKRVTGAYLESGFRYRGTPGAGVARIRFLTDRMPEMKDKELGDAIREINALMTAYAGRPKKKDEKAEALLVAQEAAAQAAEAAKTPEKAKPEKAKAEGEAPAAGKAGEAKVAVEKKEKPLKIDPLLKAPELPGIEEFSQILIDDGFRARGDFDRAGKELIGFYQKNPQSPNHDKVRARIVENIAQSIKKSVDHHDFIDALRRYSGNSGTWLKGADRTDIKYEIGKAYEQAGVYKEAGATYRAVASEVTDKNKSQSPDKKTDKKPVGLFERLPKTDALNLRQAIVAAHEHDFAGAEVLLKKITTSEQLSASEQIERAEVSADVAEARGDNDRAEKFLTDLIKGWKGDARLTGALRLRLAHLLIAQKNFLEADQHLAEIAAMQKDGGLADDVLAKALEMRGNLFLDRGKRKDAVTTLQHLVETFDGKRPLSSVRYKIGEILYQDGDLKGSETAWSGLKQEKDDVWQKLAGEQMKSAKWQDEYKKYINRIPAAVDLKQ
jgi:tetratricopeptide (TPR) repeat protein